MNVRYTLQAVDFEWDSHKAEANLPKHDVAFETACEVFFDPFVRVIDASTESELRDAAIGMSMSENGRLLFVVHIEQNENTFRLISARAATPSERRFYEDI